MKEKRTQKKSDAVTAPDFQKTNYLKTNLLKQIKKISLFGISRYYLSKFCCKVRKFCVFLQIFLHFFAQNKRK